MRGARVSKRADQGSKRGELVYVGEMQSSQGEAVHHVGGDSGHSSAKSGLDFPGVRKMRFSSTELAFKAVRAVSPNDGRKSVLAPCRRCYVLAFSLPKAFSRPLVVRGAAGFASR
jgi:hypothetical protein